VSRHQPDVDAFERAVLAQAPPGSDLIGASISPDGEFGAALTTLPSAAGYPMDDVFRLVAGRWELHSSSNGGGTTWSWLRDDVGVLRFDGEAPPGASRAVIGYEGREHPVPIRHGHFLFVAWNVPENFGEPVVVRFE
jgi:hypothetical protein